MSNVVMSWIRWLVISISQQRPVFNPSTVYVRVCGRESGRKTGFLQVLQFSIASIIPPMLHIHPFIFQQQYIILDNNSCKIT